MTNFCLVWFQKKLSDNLCSTNTKKKLNQKFSLKIATLGCNKKLCISNNCIFLFHENQNVENYIN